MIAAAELARALGGKRAGRDYLAKCPAHADRTPSLSIREGIAGPLVHCHAGCGQRDVIEALRQLGLWPSPSRSSPRPPRQTSRCDDQRWRQDAPARIWNASHDPRGTLAERYLNSRGLAFDEDDLALRVLRFHPVCWWGKGEKLPCLVAAFEAITSLEQDDVLPQAVLRIALASDGTKIGKKMLGPVTGAAIKLDADVTEGLHLAEGLETALAARSRQHWRPMWCTGAAGFMARFPVLAGVECLTIAADHDHAGLGAAQACAEQWQAAGCEVFVRWPKGLGRDYADEADR